MKRVAAVIFSILLALPTIALAQYYPSEWWSPEALAEWVFPGMSPDWLRLPNVIWYVIVPFFTAFVIVFGILKELRIFRHGGNKLHGVIAFCLAVLLLPSGILTYIVNIFYAFGTFFGLIAFGVLFILGTLFWVWGRGRGLYYEFDIQAEKVKGIRGDLRSLDEKIRQKRGEVVKEKTSRNPNLNKIANIQEEIDNLEKEKRALRESLDMVKEPI
jgi:hypothetical protein